MEKLDFVKIREERQNANVLCVFHALRSSETTRSVLNKLINTNAFERHLKLWNKTSDQVFKECQENVFYAQSLSELISVRSTRQGSLDEQLQIDACDTIAQTQGISIKCLANTSYRATKDGYIVSKQEMKEKNIKKDSCYKSFDAQITGEKMNGWVFAKVTIGNGGHQDNVFEEADNLCRWVEKYRCDNSQETFVFLLDTDLQKKHKELADKYKHIKNILITNHFDFQGYLANMNTSETPDQMKSSSLQ
jgi:hypothetical protein